MSLSIREVRLSATLGSGMTTGEVVSIGKRIYSVCRRCFRVVQLNKVLFGSLHLCRHIVREEPDVRPVPDTEAEPAKDPRPPRPLWPQARPKPPA